MPSFDILSFQTLNFYLRKQKVGVNFASKNSSQYTLQERKILIPECEGMMCEIWRMKCDLGVSELVETGAFRMRWEQQRKAIRPCKVNAPEHWFLPDGQGTEN